jgi:hypothetical protein
MLNIKRPSWYGHCSIGYCPRGSFKNPQHIRIDKRLLRHIKAKRLRKKHFLFYYIPSIFFLLCVSLMFPAYSQEAHSAQVTLAWNTNSEPTVAGYRVYYGTASRVYGAVIDVGNWTNCVISGLQNGITYFFTATAYDAEGNESSFSTEISYTVPAGASPSPDTSPATPSPGGDSGGGGGCFIATAAYGSYMAPEVMVLRKFRDDSLLTNTPGRVLVSLYYRLSPPAADFIRDRENLKTLSRWVLTPVVYAIKHPAALALFVPGLFLAVYCIAHIRRSRKSSRKNSQATHA